MKRPILKSVVMLSMIIGGTVVTKAAAEVSTPKKTVQNFDAAAVGKLPAGWKIEATRQRGPLPTWQVTQDKTAPSGGKVLTMSSPNHRSGGTFNLCWTDDIKFLNGEITVKFKALKGRGDQGGGIMWRVQDKDNYYVVRFNPLEDNFRFYKVQNSVRRQLASATVKLAPGWHRMKIVQQGSHYECRLDGQKLLSGEVGVFNKAGGVGLWTKADAVTSFDDFTVKTGGDK